jgi:cytochrome c oxidase subunit 3
MNDSVTYQNRHHPRVFLLGLLFVGIIMMFVALTSAYMVRKAAGNWLEYELPNIFYINTFLILCTSFTIHRAKKLMKSGLHDQIPLMLMLTLAGGILFLGLQYYGWTQLTDLGVALNGNVSGSFMYIISGFHALHVVGGIIALVICLMVFKMRLANMKNNYWLGLEMTVYYWHFLTFLWVYLLLFILTQ